MAATSGSPREGRRPLVEAAADLFGTATFKEAAGFIGPRSVAEAAGKSLGTFTHHFPANRGRDIQLEALRCALTRVGDMETAALSEDLGAATGRVTSDGDVALDDLADALVRELAVFSPEEGPNNLIVEAEETAAFIAAAVAPRDEAAAQLLREVTAPRINMYLEAANELAEAVGLRWADDVSARSFALAAHALATGFLWTRRFDREVAPLSLYADMLLRLFTASTAPAVTEAPEDYRLSLLSSVAVPAGSHLDPAKRAAIVDGVHRLYDRRHRWDDITITAVRDEANVSRPTIIAHFHDRNGLAAALWTRHLPGLEDELKRNTRLPFTQALHFYLTALVTAARQDKYVTGAFLDGVFAYTIQHGPPNPDDPADPRNLVPLPPMLMPLIEANVNLFRPGNASTPLEALDTSALLINQTLHLALTRPRLQASAVAGRIRETTLAGMLLRRPKL